jgi:Tfp pilus assembly protein PilF
MYERGLQALQRHDYARAAELLASVMERFPEERELHDRARLYLKVCERQTKVPPPPPRTSEERVYAATLALNSGDHARALDLLQGVAADNPEDDHVQYMLAVTHVLSGQDEAALRHLKRAIQLNPENRSLARQEPDFEDLRRRDGFRVMLDSLLEPAQVRRRLRLRAR